MSDMAFAASFGAPFPSTGLPVRNLSVFRRKVYFLTIHAADSVEYLGFNLRRNGNNDSNASRTYPKDILPFQASRRDDSGKYRLEDQPEDTSAVDIGSPRSVGGGTSDRPDRTWGSGSEVDEAIPMSRSGQQRGPDSGRGEEYTRSRDEFASKDSVIRSNFRTSSSPPQPRGKNSEEFFEERVSEAVFLMREGRTGIDGAIEVGVAEEYLYESVRLFEAAIELKPKDTAVIGQCGNALLAHGELKLKIARQMRTQVPPSQPPPPRLSRGGGREGEEERWQYEDFDRERRRAVDVVFELADECEMLLIEAGRKYRASLTLDNRDVRSLHNWGLALWLRGQLIVDEGEEGSMETADKMFLAAIDKYETMLAMSDQWRTNALLHWGLALRDRSRLRPMEAPDRMRLMNQARELFAEAVRFEPSNTQAKGGVLACDLELKGIAEFLRAREMPKRKEMESGQFFDRGNKQGETSWW